MEVLAGRMAALADLGDRKGQGVPVGWVVPVALADRMGRRGRS